MENLPCGDSEQYIIPDEIVIKDEAYWAEVRAAVGSGTPSILFGTSTHALHQALSKIREAQQTVTEQDAPT